MVARAFDEAISRAWREAAEDLGIRVVAPFRLRTQAGDTVTYEAYIADFGGPNGTIVRVIDLDDKSTDIRQSYGYYASDLGTSYRQYERELFIATLDDWQWFGDEGVRPPWYTAKVWGH